jgi:hypothetical protein
MKQNYIKSSSIGQTRLATKAAPKQTATQKMLRSIFFCIVFILSCALAPTAVTGQVVLNNKSAEVGDNYKAGFNGGFGAIEKAAQGFTTGTALTAQSISVDLVMTTAEGTPAANFTVRICGETGGQPDESNILATLSGNSNPAAAGTYTYTGTVTWAAGQNLFIVCSANTLAGAYLWNYTLDAPITTSNAYTAPFSLQINSVGNWTNGSDQRFLFSLTVSTAPSCTAPHYPHRHQYHVNNRQHRLDSRRYRSRLGICGTSRRRYSTNRGRYSNKYEPYYGDWIDGRNKLRVLCPCQLWQ